MVSERKSAFVRGRLGMGVQWGVWGERYTPDVSRGRPSSISAALAHHLNTLPP